MGQVVYTTNCVFCGRLMRKGDLCKRHMRLFNKWTKIIRAELYKEKAANRSGSQPHTPSIA